MVSCHFQLHTQWISNVTILVNSNIKIALSQNTEWGHNIALFHPLLCFQEGCSLVLCMPVSMVRGMPPNWPWSGSAESVSANLTQPWLEFFCTYSSVTSKNEQNCGKLAIKLVHIVFDVDSESVIHLLWNGAEHGEKVHWNSTKR